MIRNISYPWPTYPRVFQVRVLDWAVMRVFDLVDPHTAIAACCRASEVAGVEDRHTDLGHLVLGVLESLAVDADEDGFRMAGLWLGRLNKAKHLLYDVELLPGWRRL